MDGLHEVHRAKPPLAGNTNGGRAVQEFVRFFTHRGFENLGKNQIVIDGQKSEDNQKLG